MADKAIGDLERASNLYTGDLLPIEQGGNAKAISGNILANFARERASQEAARAEGFAADAEESAQNAESWSKHPPYIGENGNWWVYNINTDRYVDSGVDASITVAIADITMLPEGDSPSVTNTGTDTDPVFHLFLPRGATGATGNGIASIQLNSDYTLTIAYTNGQVYTSGSIRGATGNGILNVVVNPDYTLTVTYTDGQTYTSGSIRGATGNGIASAVLNPDYTLTITFTDGTSTTTSSIRGEQGPQGIQGNTGNGIASMVLNADYTLTITFTDGTSTTTTPIRGEKGEQGIQGNPGVSPVVTITSITGGHRVIITDATHPSGQSFDVMDGTGDMVTATYDPQGAVAAAGGIPGYVSANGSKPVQVYVNLSATWSGTGPYTQVVSVEGVTVNSEVSFRPNAAQLQQFINDGVSALYVENDDGICTAVAVGAVPSVAMRLVAEVAEVKPMPEVSLTPKSSVTYTNGISDLSDSELDEIAETISAASATVTNETAELYFDYDNTHRHISIGDQISYTMDGNSYPFRIMGFNHYDKSDGSGKAGILMQMVDCFNTTQKMTSSVTSNAGWHNSDLRTWMNGTMLGYLPSAAQSTIKQVNISTAQDVSTATLSTTVDKLFVPAEVEVFGSATRAEGGTAEGTWYAWYKANNTAANRVKKVNGSANTWWERSPDTWRSAPVRYAGFCCVLDPDKAAQNGTDDGMLSVDSANGVAPCFCI